MPTHEREYNTWTTRDEVKFIKGVGRHADQTLKVKMAKRSRLLKSYLRLCYERDDWGEIDKRDISIVIREAERELEKALDDEGANR